MKAAARALEQSSSSVTSITASSDASPVVAGSPRSRRRRGRRPRARARTDGRRGIGDRIGRGPERLERRLELLLEAAAVGAERGDAGEVVGGLAGSTVPAS